MGGGASSLIRLRKALVIRAYNLRKAELTLDEQFRPHAIRQVIFYSSHFSPYSMLLISVQLCCLLNHCLICFSILTI